MPELENELLRLENPSRCVAISVPNSGYLLGLNLPHSKARRIGEKCFGRLCDRGINIFKKYKIKSVILWDDPFGQFTQSIVNSPPENLKKVKTGVINVLKKYFSDWDCFHLAWDSGHLNWIKSFNFLPEKNLHISPLPTHVCFIKPDRKRITTRNLAFFGNVYLSNLRRDPLLNDLSIKKIYEEITNHFSIISSTENKDLLTALCTEILDRKCKKWEDSTLFWPIYRKVIWYLVNTKKRMAILNNLKKEISFFGNFADPESSSLFGRNIQFQGNLDFFNDLPRAFEETKVSIDVTNSLAINGVTGKFFECYASNGFMLIDFKSDLVKLLGDEIAKKIVYTSLSDLNEKIDYFLNNSSEREEIRQTIKNIVVTKCCPQKWCYKINEICD